MSRVLVGTVLVSCLLSLGGCIVSIKSEEGATGPAYDGNSTAKVKLSREDRDTLPLVQTTADLPTIRSTYAQELGKLGPSTTLEQFRALFPGATFVERRDAAGTKLDAYAVRLEKKFRYRDESYGYMARDEKWFYFRDGLFMKWSGPKEWPEEAK
jgi:hypothetical protein